NWSDCVRFATPFLGRPLAVTIPTGTVIFVTPKAAAFRADIGELLRHELSHAVLKQNRSLVSVLRMRNQPWVSEGVAGLAAEMGRPLQSGSRLACRRRSSCCEQRGKSCGDPLLRYRRRTGVSAIRHGSTSGTGRLSEAGKRHF